MQQHVLLALTVIASGAITENRFVGFDGAMTGAGGDAFGIAETNAVDGDDLAVNVFGTAVVEAGAALTPGAQVQSDAAGRAIPLAAGEQTGVVMPGENAGAAGELLEILLK